MEQLACCCPARVRLVSVVHLREWGVCDSWKSLGLRFGQCKEAVVCKAQCFYCFSRKVSVCLIKRVSILLCINLVQLVVVGQCCAGIYKIG